MEVLLYLLKLELYGSKCTGFVESYFAAGV